MKGDLLEKEEAQEKYCEEHDRLYFIPPYGVCYYCGKSVWDKYTLEEAGSKHITYCPHCRRSWCD